MSVLYTYWCKLIVYEQDWGGSDGQTVFDCHYLFETHFGVTLLNFRHFLVQLLHQLLKKKFAVLSFALNSKHYWWFFVEKFKESEKCFFLMLDARKLWEVFFCLHYSVIFLLRIIIYLCQKPFTQLMLMLPVLRGTVKPWQVKLPSTHTLNIYHIVHSPCFKNVVFPFT